MPCVIDQEHPIGDNRVLRDCSPATIAAVLELGERCYCSAGDQLFAEGADAGVVLFALCGNLQMSKTSSRVRRQVLCSTEGSACNDLCLLAMADRALADVRALAPTEVLLLKRDDYQRLARQDPALCQNGWRSAIQCMTHFSALVETLSFRKVAERVSLTLLENAGRDGGVVHLTQAELAAEVGTTREVVARCLGGLQQTGAIRLGRGRITVTDHAKLAAQE